MADLDKVFKAGKNFKASDIHLAPGEPLIFRRFGRLMKTKTPPLTASQTSKLILEILDEKQRAVLEEEMQLDFSYDLPGTGRFRGAPWSIRTG